MLHRYRIKNHDLASHKAAQALKQAATRSDGQVIIELAVLQASCLA